MYLRSGFELAGKTATQIPARDNLVPTGALTRSRLQQTRTGVRPDRNCDLGVDGDGGADDPDERRGGVTGGELATAAGYPSGVSVLQPIRVCVGGSNGSTGAESKCAAAAAGTGGIGGDKVGVEGGA